MLRTEEEIHCQIKNDLDRMGIFYVHIPNQGKRTLQHNMLLKRMGLRKGASDFFILDSDHEKKYKGLWLEVKTIKGKASPEQIEFMDQVKRRGYQGLFGYGYDHCIKIIREFYGI